MDATISTFATIAFIAFLAVITPEPLSAHHSLAAEYDQTKAVTLTGVVAKVDWINPHSYIYLDVTGPAGKTVRWKLEGYPPRFLSDNSWEKDTLHKGDEVTIRGWQARNGDAMAHATTVKFPDGHVLLFGVDPGRGPGPKGKGKGRGPRF